MFDKLLLIFAVSLVLIPDLSVAQTCMNQQFVSSFISVESCVGSNSILGCGTAYAVVGGIASAGASFLGKSYFDRQPRKLPFPLNDEVLDSYFRKVPVSEQLKLEVASDQLSEQTVKTLRRKGYKVDDIEKVRQSLNEYRKRLALTQDRLDAEEDLKTTGTKTRQYLKIGGKKLYDVWNDVWKNVNNGQPIDPFMNKMDGKFKLPDEIINRVDKHINTGFRLVRTGDKNPKPWPKREPIEIESPASKASSEIMSLREPSPMNRAVIRNGILGAFGGIAVVLGPVVRDEVAIQKCKSQIGFKDEADARSFREFGTVGSFSSCRTELNPTKIWDLLLMEPGDRTSLSEGFRIVVACDQLTS